MADPSEKQMLLEHHERMLREFGWLALGCTEHDAAKTLEALAPKFPGLAVVGGTGRSQLEHCFYTPTAREFVLRSIQRDLVMLRTGVMRLEAALAQVQQA